MSAAEKATSFPRNKKASAPRSGNAPPLLSKKETEAEASEADLYGPSYSVLPAEAFERFLADLEAPSEAPVGLLRAIEKSKGVLRSPDLDEWNRAERIRS